MPKPAFIDENAKISAAALQIAGAKGWASVTLDAVAKAAKIAPAKIKQRFTAPQDLVPVIAAEIDREAFAAFGQVSGTPHDILFDLLMARFDVLQKNRQAILSMAATIRQDRALSCALARATLDGVYRVIAASRLKEPPRPVLALGIAAIYGWAFWAWQRDDSRDMAKTMAALDRALRLSGKALDLLKRRS